MGLDLTTPALLFPAVAILMLGYINRYIATAGVIRTYVKDYHSGYKHMDVAGQLKVLRKRIGLSKLMMASASVALLFACLSMLLIFEELRVAGETTFAVALFFMILSVIFSLNETALSNKSLSTEIDTILSKEKARD